MIQLNVSGSYVSLVVNGSIQEELNKDTDQVEYNKYSDGKVSLIFGRRSFVQVSPTDFEIDGEAVTDAADFVTKLEAVFTRYGAAPGGSSYLVYTAKLTQVTTGNPSSTDYADGINVGSWSRTSTGYFTSPITGTINVSKIYISGFCPRLINADSIEFQPMPIFDIGSPNALIGSFNLYIYDNGDGTGAIELQTWDLGGALADFSTFGATGTTGWLMLPEIRVYP
jgi:hypothetical protein